MKGVKKPKVRRPNGTAIFDLSLIVPPHVIVGAASGNPRDREIIDGYRSNLPELTPAMVVRRARISGGITVKALAASIGRSRMWLVKRELGLKRLRADDVERLLEMVRMIATRRSAAVAEKGSR